MINLHLLTKISQKDQAFRKNILQMVSASASRVITESENARSSNDWNKCYFILKNYLASIQPYCQLSYLNSLKNRLEALKDSKKVNLKIDTYQKIIESINQSLVSLASGPDKGTTRLRSDQTFELQ